MIISFGYRHGQPPTDADRVIDVRDLPNPHAYRNLRTLTGHEPAVVKFLKGFPVVEVKLQVLSDMYQTDQSQLQREPVWAVGCTGGRHRSVMVAEAVGARVGSPVEHRDCPCHAERGDANEVPAAER